MSNISPIIKWVGGKRRIMERILKLTPKTFNNYYEPFIGGGSVFLNIPYRKKAFINDYNQDLINIYMCIKNDYNILYRKLKKIEKIYNDIQDITGKNEYFKRNREKMNNLKNKMCCERAALYIFLNKTCFNGIMTENLKGEIKPSFGFHEKIHIANKNNIQNFSEKLKSSVYITNIDYKESLTKVKKGDFVYLDPPYVPDDITNHNYKYNGSKSWKLEDFNMFFELVDNLDRKGVYFMMSNSYSKLIRSYYKKTKYNIYKIPISRNISVKSSTRGIKNEVIITNYK